MRDFWFCKSAGERLREVNPALTQILVSAMDRLGKSLKTAVNTRMEANVLGLRRWTNRLVWLVCGFGLLTSAFGCAFGPMALEKTHARYNETILRVDEEQLLRNLVRIRYNQAPYQLNVASIAAQYELAGAVEARPFFAVPNPDAHAFRSFTSILPDLLVSGANRPTITLIPAEDGETRRRYLTPISVETLIFFTETSWPVSTVMRLWVERLNGVPNAPTSSGPPRNEVPDFERFQRITFLMQRVQDQELAVVHTEERPVLMSGPLTGANPGDAVEAAKNGMQIQTSAGGAGSVLIKNQPRLVLELNPTTVGNPEIEELRQLLNLKAGQSRYDLVRSLGLARDPLRFPSEPRPDLSIATRSTAQVFFFLANGVEVPCEHLESGIAQSVIAPGGKPFDLRAVTSGLFQVHCYRGHKPPEHAYVAIKHLGYWYYIDDRDQESKSTFALVLQLSRLDFINEKTGGPILTLPVGR